MGKRRRGGIKLAEEVIRLVEEPNDFTYSYELEGSIEDKLNQIVQKSMAVRELFLQLMPRNRQNSWRIWDSETARSVWQKHSTA